MMRLLLLQRVAGLFAILISFSALATEPNIKNHSIVSKIPASVSVMPERLSKGLMLFEYHQGDFFDAIVSAPDLTNDQDKLNYAHSLAEFGMLDKAKKIYDRVKNKGTAKSKSIAFFELGKTAFNNAEWASALELFKKADRNISKEIKEELKYYQASTYIKQEEYSKAASILGKMKESKWVAYAYYNLGIAYAEIDSEPTRSIISLRVADALNKKDSETLIELKDQTLLAAGYLSVQAEDYKKSLSFLNQVRVDSDLASKALYMHGVANSSLEFYRAAIQSWYRVKKYPLIDQGVADAFLAIPYAYDKEGYSSKAIASYLEAISVFDKETRNIDKIIAAVSKSGARKTFFEKSSLDDLEWFLSDSIATNTPKVAYLKHLMADSLLHQLATRSLELESLYKNLSLWESDLGVYQKMLNRRINGYYQRIKKADTKSNDRRIDGIVSSTASLDKKLVDAEAQQNLMAVAAGKTLDRFDSVSELNKQLSEVKAKVGTLEFNDLKIRINRLSGLVMWEAKEQYERNLRLSKESIRELKREIQRYEDGVKHFNELIAKGPHRLETFKARIEDLMVIVKNKKKQVAHIRDQQSSKLTQYVIKLLEAKKIEFVTYHETAQQRLAHLYEYVAVTQYAAKKKKEDKQ